MAEEVADSARRKDIENGSPRTTVRSTVIDLFDANEHAVLGNVNDTREKKKEGR